VGAHLLAGLPTTSHQLSWWRKGDDEVDFVVTANEIVWAIEVKSGRPSSARGPDVFRGVPSRAARCFLRNGCLPFTSPFGQRHPKSYCYIPNPVMSCAKQSCGAENVRTPTRLYDLLSCTERSTYASGVGSLTFVSAEPRNGVTTIKWARCWVYP